VFFFSVDMRAVVASSDFGNKATTEHEAATAEPLFSDRVKCWGGGGSLA
jgi:hypothetical protein